MGIVAGDEKNRFLGSSGENACTGALACVQGCLLLGLNSVDFQTQFKSHLPMSNC